MDDLNYMEVIEKAPFAYALHQIVLDEQGRPSDYIILRVNSEFERITGLNAQSVCGKKALEIIPGIGESEFQWIDVYGRVAVYGENIDFEQYFEPLGKWYKVNAYSPEPGFFITVFVDITPEKDKEQELERFFQVNLDLLCIADMNGWFIKLNREWESVTGYTLEELMKINFLDLVHPEDYAPTIKAVSRLKDRHRVLNFVNRYRCADGSYRYLEWRSNSYGKIIYAAARDITQRVQETADLEKNRQMLVEAGSMAKMGRWDYYHRDQSIVWSENVSEIFELPEKVQSLSYTDFLGMVYPDDRDELNRKWLDSIRDGSVYDIEHRLLTPAGKLKWFRERSRTEYDEAGRPVHTAGIVQDITSLKQAEAELLFQSGVQRLLAGISSSFINVSSRNFARKAKGLVAAAGDFFGVDRCYFNHVQSNSLVVDSYYEWNAPGIMKRPVQKKKKIYVDEFPYLGAALIKRKHVQIPDTHISPAGAKIDSEMLRQMGVRSILCVPVLLDGRLSGFLGFECLDRIMLWDEMKLPYLKVMANILGDSLKRKRLEDELVRISITDPLTGLNNRRYLMKRMEEILHSHRRGGKPFAVAIFDIDFFKNLNDAFGHAAGDAVLQLFASILKSGVRPYDVAARYGGEEFVIAVSGVGRDTAVLLCERILDKVRASAADHRGRDITFTSSCGVATSNEFNSDTITAESIINLADNRLYRAKRGGRNRVVSKGGRP